MKFYREGESSISKKRFIATHEFREPKKGEWFISGALPEVYLAFNDMTVKYHIAKEVKTKVIEVII